MEVYKKGLMEKQTKLEILHRFYLPMAVKLFPKDLLDTDLLSIECANEGHILLIERERIETDEEFNDRLDTLGELKERRFKTYLKLKKEFENV